MRKALLIVDYQVDFVADDGLLSVGKSAQAIEAAILCLADGYDAQSIYFTLDTHALTDWEGDVCPEGRIFPPHCLKGSTGHQIYGRIRDVGCSSNWFEKQAYCPKHEDLLALVHAYDEITVVGVVTDICVFQTVIGLYTTAVNAGVQLVLRVDAAACASFDAERERWALAYLEEVLQVEVLNKKVL